MGKHPDGWIDRDVALSVSFDDVFAELRLEHAFTFTGDERKGFCPIGSEHGKKDSFGANVQKRIFNCFACKKKGNVIDFVMAFNGCSFKDAAEFLVALAERRASAGVEHVPAIVQEAPAGPCTLDEREQLIARVILGSVAAYLAELLAPLGIEVEVIEQGLLKHFDLLNTL